MHGRMMGVLLGGLALAATPPVHAEEPDRSDVVDENDDDAEPAPRGLTCRRTCEDRYAEDARDCDKLPDGWVKKGCMGRASWIYRMCLKFCQPGARDCIDDDVPGSISCE